MKPWMIIAGVGVVGVALATLLVPWGRLSTPDMPDIPLPSAPPPSAVIAADDDRPDLEPLARPSANTQPTARSTTSAGFEHDIARASQGGGTLSPARQAAAERIHAIDMQLARNSETKWQAMFRNMANKPKDPSANYALDRAAELRPKLDAYARDPSSHDINVLMAEQEHILNQLRQTRYWDADFENMYNEIDQQWTQHRTETGARHPSR
jgi:hypothetical protein